MRKETELREANRDRLKSLRDLKREITTFDEIDAFIDKLVEQTRGKYTGVYGIPRAGLLLAILYSYRTNVPLLLAPYPGCLVIDDDIGTGLTMKPYVGKYDTAVMYSRPECEVVPTYIGAMYDNETYRVFAWNKEEDLRW